MLSTLDNRRGHYAASKFISQLLNLTMLHCPVCVIVERDKTRKGKYSYVACTGLLFNFNFCCGDVNIAIRSS